MSIDTPGPGSFNVEKFIDTKGNRNFD